MELGLTDKTRVRFQLLFFARLKPQETLPGRWKHWRLALPRNSQGKAGPRILHWVPHGAERTLSLREDRKVPKATQQVSRCTLSQE